MPDFEDDYIHAEGQAHIVVEAENNGEFHFGYVSGYLRGEYIEKEGKKTFRFDWEGSDEMDGQSAWDRLYDSFQKRRQNQRENQICFWRYLSV
jgi:hypothetical protein